MSRAQTGITLALGLVVGLISGWAIGLGAPAERAPAVMAAARPAPPSATKIPSPACPDATCDQALNELKGELRFQQMLYDSLWEEHFGRRVQWPEATPAVYTRAGFEEVVERSLANCDTDLSARGLECTEPPCIGAFVFNAAQQFYPRIAECQHWSDAYGETVSTYSSSVDCGDGKQETILLLAPYWEQVAEPEDPAEAENFRKRIEERHKALVDAWTCAKP